MCVHEFYHSVVCGHDFPKLPQPARLAFFSDPYPTIYVPQSLTCIPVKLALKFYHDQVVYQPSDMTCGTKVVMPRSCPIVHDLPEGTSSEVLDKAYQGQWKADQELWDAMIQNGLGPHQQWQVERYAEVADRCSNRFKPGEYDATLLGQLKSQDYPPNMYKHVQDVRAYQERDRSYMIPNVRYIEVDFGCGGPFSPECVNGWNGIRLLTHRLHLWGDGTTHPRPCNHECLAGWSGVDLDTYRRETWPRDSAIRWRNTPDYPKSAKKILAKKSRDAKQWWIALDFSNISHRHVGQRKWLLTEQELRSATVPQDVWVPVPNRLLQFLTDSREAGLEETPRMKDERIWRARNVIRERIRTDHPPREHPMGEKDVVVEEGQILIFPSCTQARQED